jgi:hypothetical protein
LQKLLLLAVAQQRVDLADQPVGAGEGRGGVDLRDTRLGQPILQRRAPLGDRVGLGAAILGHGAERFDLCLQRTDPRGVGVLGGQKLLPPTHEGCAQVLEKRGGCRACLKQVFDTVGFVFPCVVVYRLRDLRDLRGGRVPDLSDDLLRPDHEDQGQHQREEVADHAPSNTEGTSRPGPCSHGGTGSPFSVRNSALNSLD